MRQHRLPRVLRAADLQHHDGLAQLPRARGRPAKPLGLLESLDERADDGGGRVLDEELDVVLDREPGLVAARDDVAEPHAALLHQVFADRETEAAALRDEPHTAGPQGLRHVGAELAGALADVEDAVAVRAADEQPPLGQALELGLPRAAGGPGFAEPTRQHDGAAHAARDGGTQYCGNLLGGDRDDRAVRGLRRRGEVGIAGQPEDVGMIRPA